MSEGTLRYIRLTNSTRLSDRYLTVQVKEPTDPSQNHLGKIFTIVEIEGGWNTYSQIGQSIINNLARAYFNSTEKDASERFEEAIKAVNDNLAQIAHSHQDLPEKIHALLAVINGDQIHLTATGRVYGWVTRDGKASKIFDQKDIQPTKGNKKIFNFIISGDLELEDRLIFTSSGILQSLTIAEIKENVFDADDLYSGALRLGQLLKAKRSTWINGLLLSLTETKKIENKKPRPFPDTLYLDSSSLVDWKVHLQQGAKKIHTAVLDIGRRLKTVNDHIDRKFRTNVIPNAQKHSQTIQTLSSGALKDLQQKHLPKLTQSLSKISSDAARKLAKNLPTTKSIPIDSDQSIIGKNLYNINEYAINTNPQLSTDAEEKTRVNYYQQSPNNGSKPKHGKKISFSPDDIISSISQSLQKFMRTSDPNFGFKAIIGILVLILIWNIVAIINQGAQTDQDEALIAQIETLENKLEEAQLAKALNQDEKALEALIAIVDEAELLNNSKVAERAKNVFDQAQKDLDRFTNTTRVSNLEPLYTTENGKLIASGHDKVLISSNNSASFTNSEQSLNSFEGGQISGLAAYDNKEAFGVMTDKPAWYEVDKSGNIKNITPTGGEWKKGNAADTYFNNVYVLSANENQIWKFTSTDGQLAAASAYIEETIDISHAVDLAIDGNVYVLTDTGEITKFGRGKKVNFNLSDLPKPYTSLVNAKAIITDSDGDNLYVLADNRVVALSKDGKYQHQYILNLPNAPVDITLDKAKNKILALTQTGFYELELK